MTYEGQPVEQGRVLFEPVQPAEGQPSQPAVGSLGADGKYQLASFAGGEGVAPGEYRVGVESRSGGPTPEEPNAPFEWHVPEELATPSSSGLTASVPAGGDFLELNFDLP